MCGPERSTTSSLLLLFSPPSLVTLSLTLAGLFPLGLEATHANSFFEQTLGSPIPYIFLFLHMLGMWAMTPWVPPFVFFLSPLLLGDLGLPNPTPPHLSFLSTKPQYFPTCSSFLFLCLTSFNFTHSSSSSSRPLHIRLSHQLRSPFTRLKRL